MKETFITVDRIGLSNSYNCGLILSHISGYLDVKKQGQENNNTDFYIFRFRSLRSALRCMRYISINIVHVSIPHKIPECGFIKRRCLCSTIKISL